MNNTTKNIPTEIIEFAKQIGKRLVINERSNDLVNNWKLDKFYISFKGVETKKGNYLTGSCGNGKTITQAIKDYCKQLSNETVVVDAYKPTRQEFKTGKIIYTKNKHKTLIMEIDNEKVMVEVSISTVTP